jgi:hypothetical protein
MSRGTFWAIIILSALFSGSAFAEKPLSVGGGGGGGLGGGEMRKPLEVKGQTRTINMMMVMQAQKDKINFIGPRRNYRKQILTTAY